MPGRATNVVVGTIAGATTAAFRARHEPDGRFLLETLGGGAGGYLGGQLPDILEPATSSWHRSFAHSVAAGTGIAYLAHERLSAAQEWCRRQADTLAARRAQMPADSFAACLLALAETTLRILAGLLAGLVAGYLSHLVLDARTARSIRLI